MEIENLEKAEKIRGFLALPVQSKYYPELLKHQKFLENCLRTPSVAWTQKARLHLTLFFLGDQYPSQLALFAKRMTQMLQNTEAVALPCSEMGLFPDENPSVVALTGPCPRGLYNLRNNIFNCLQESNIKPDLSHETHGFLPHVTLGTLKQQTDLKPENVKTLLPFNEVVLYQSEWFAPYVVKHTALYTWPLI